MEISDTKQRNTEKYPYCAFDTTNVAGHKAPFREEGSASIHPLTSAITYPEWVNLRSAPHHMQLCDEARQLRSKTTSVRFPGDVLRRRARPRETLAPPPVAEFFPPRNACWRPRAQRIAKTEPLSPEIQGVEEFPVASP